MTSKANIKERELSFKEIKTKEIAEALNYFGAKLEPSIFSAPGYSSISVCEEIVATTCEACLKKEGHKNRVDAILDAETGIIEQSVFDTFCKENLRTLEKLAERHFYDCHATPEEIAEAERKAEAAKKEQKDREIKVMADKKADDIRAKKVALRIVQEEDTKPLPAPECVVDFMQREFSQEPWLFSGLIEVGQNVVLSGYRKAGKTTTVLNALRAYCVGGSFLGVFESGDSVGECPVGYLNMEVNERDFQKYVRKMGLEEQEKLHVWNLTGHRFNILEDLHYEELGNWVVDKQLCSLFIDPLRNVFVGDENDNSLAKEVTDRFDSLKVESGCLNNLLIVCHTGHANGQDDEPGAFARPRGAARWGDWPAVMLSLTTNRQRDRFFSMIGRNGEFTASQLLMVDDPNRPGGMTLYLDMATGPHDVRSNQLEKVILKALLGSHPGPLNSSQLKEACRGDDKATLAVISQLQASGLISREKKGTSYLHRLTESGLTLVTTGVVPGSGDSQGLPWEPGQVVGEVVGEGA